MVDMRKVFQRRAGDADRASVSHRCIQGSFPGLAFSLGSIGLCGLRGYAHHNCSACSCHVGFSFHCPSLPPAADVAVSMTSLATIASLSGSWGSRSSGLCIGFCGRSGAEELEEEFLPT